MAIEIFNRHENKYLLDAKTYAKLQRQLSGRMELDAYNKTHETYSICNLYYDTDDSYLIRTSLQKPCYKEKLRMRSYGTPDLDARVYVEIKKKFCGLTNKRRSGLRLSDAYAFLDTGALPDAADCTNRQVTREIAYMLTQRRLAPKVYLSYDRRAFFEKENSDLRVSFDTNIITRRQDLRLESGSWGERLLADGTWLMEIKTAKAIPLWFTRLLSEHQVYPASFSKYGAAYTASLAPGVREPCENIVSFPAHRFAENPLPLARASLG
ncbi:MAG: polyphosphate polymerase domain-containing protein [Oscillospiraceae bacterium]|jgi:hypothetical protein|nr:polyphosphate polymerase domain-containing protein [Oscillospiraceae bacterium]